MIYVKQKSYAYPRYFEKDEIPVPITLHKALLWDLGPEANSQIVEAITILIDFSSQEVQEQILKRVLTNWEIVENPYPK